MVKYSIMDHVDHIVLSPTPLKARPRLRRTYKVDFPKDLMSLGLAGHIPELSHDLLWQCAMISICLEDLQRSTLLYSH